MRRDWSSKFSDNIKDFDGYSIGKLFKLLNDPEIISLAGGLPSPDVFLKDDLRRISQERLLTEIDKIMQYTPITGEDELIKAIQRFLQKDDIHLSEDQIVVTSSGQQGLDMVGRLFLNPGDVVLVDRPTFAGALVAFQMQRARFEGVNLEEDGTDVSALRRRIEELKKEGVEPKFIYVVPDFQNPSGISMSAEKREALLDVSYDYGVLILEDSPYRSFGYYGDVGPTIFSLDQKRGGGNVIGSYTFSKLFCPGMRVGFNIGPKAVIEKMTNVKEGNVLNTPKYNQDMCAAFLNELDVDAHLLNCRDYYREKLELFQKSMEENFPNGSGVTWTRPRGGLFVWVTLPEHLNTHDLFYEAIKYKVAFVPGDAFYGENPEYNHMRINFSYPSKEQLREGVRRLAMCVEKAAETS